jgi:hypothetical protein
MEERVHLCRTGLASISRDVRERTNVFKERLVYRGVGNAAATGSSHRLAHDVEEGPLHGGVGAPEVLADHGAELVSVKSGKKFAKPYSALLGQGQCPGARFTMVHGGRLSRR